MKSFCFCWKCYHEEEVFSNNVIPKKSSIKCLFDIKSCCCVYLLKKHRSKAIPPKVEFENISLSLSLKKEKKNEIKKDKKALVEIKR